MSRDKILIVPSRTLPCNADNRNFVTKLFVRFLDRGSLKIAQASTRSPKPQSHWSRRGATSEINRSTADQRVIICRSTSYRRRRLTYRS